MQFYTTAQLGPTRHLLKNGTLLCKNVPIARTGRLLYKDHEIDIKGDKNRVVRIERDAAEVFSPSAIASFNGAAVTIDHPPEAVTPRNWQAYAKGTVTNARQGSGVQADLLLADLLITDGDTIRRLMEGPDRNPQVSSGYECDYEEIGPALGRQVGIIGNHVAFVKAGRAGPRCSVGDSAMAVRKPIKTVRKHLSLSDRIRTAFESGDADQLERALSNLDDDDDDASGQPTVHVHLPAAAMQTKEAALTIDKETMDVQTVLQTFDSRMTGIEGAIAGFTTDLKTVMDKLTLTKDAKGDEDDEDKKKEELAKKKKDTTDAATVLPTEAEATALQAAFALAIPRAEILAPGIKTMTFDAAMPLQATNEALHAFHAKALSVAIANDETNEIIKPIISPGLDLTKMTNDAVALMFTTAAELVRSHRNAQQKTGAAPSGLLMFNTAKNPNSPAELNKKYAEFSAKNYAH